MKKKPTKKATPKKQVKSKPVKKKITTAFRGRHQAAIDASKGNSWWERRTTHGRAKIWGTPELLKDAIDEYFKIVREEETIYVVDYKVVMGKLKEIKKPHAVPYTMEGLTDHLGVSRYYFTTFKMGMKKDDPHRDGFLRVIEYAERTIYKQKYQGASAGIFNANLISYDLGIRRDEAQAAASGGVVINVNSGKDQSLLEDVKKQLNDIDNGSE